MIQGRPVARTLGGAAEDVGFGRFRVDLEDRGSHAGPRRVAVDGLDRNRHGPMRRPEPGAKRVRAVGLVREVELRRARRGAQGQLLDPDVEAVLGADRPHLGGEVGRRFERNDDRWSQRCRQPREHADVRPDVEHRRRPALLDCRQETGKRVRLVAGKAGSGEEVADVRPHRCPDPETPLPGIRRLAERRRNRRARPLAPARPGGDRAGARHRSGDVSAPAAEPRRSSSPSAASYRVAGRRRTRLQNATQHRPW